MPRQGRGAWRVGGQGGSGAFGRAAGVPTPPAPPRPGFTYIFYSAFAGVIETFLSVSARVELAYPGRATGPTVRASTFVTIFFYGHANSDWWFW